jgi:hypothetical protein
MDATGRFETDTGQSDEQVLGPCMAAQSRKQSQTACACEPLDGAAQRFADPGQVRKA